MLLERCSEQNLEEWVTLRLALWPDDTHEQHRREAASMLAREAEGIAFLLRDEDGVAVAFAEAMLRRDYVNGCDSSPVGFLEGIYVHPEHRRRGIARKLCSAVEDWAAGLGCTEFASDVLLDNAASQKVHAALGFEETERVVYYRKPIAR